MTWIEVASDAVKIGLGGVIGALAALLNTYLSNRNKNNEEYSKRRRDALEKIMPTFEKNCLEAMKEAAMVVSAFSEDNINIDKSLYNYENRSTETYNINNTFNLLESQVTLIGYEDLAMEIEAFREKSLNLYQTKESSKKRLSDEGKFLHTHRTIITKMFSSAYKNA